MAAPKITLYTSYSCPWAHRAQVVLRELNLDFETVIIDLSVPRSAEYLAVNPRGLVPALAYNGEILTESSVISQFLVDAHPSHLEKTSSEPGGAFQRAKINFFVDTYFSKVHGLTFVAWRAEKGPEKDEAAKKVVDAIVKDIEPLLKVCLFLNPIHCEHTSHASEAVIS
ncbi:putative glutathione S-transferase [Amylocarpus encephaloides]|uniref:Glutathione S-transferase n=1 Tax=Amylocarpus encephaloides TaxID=45428 RepID=A0A9P7YNI0_9HELO|nr:putative glutathione S-transferase [Amylocarpus encephaloides]